MPADMPAQVEKIITGGASVFVAGLGVPTEVIDMCHEAGVLVANMCGKVDHARKAVDAGCDLVIAQGTEAGGHTGKVATMALVPQIVDTVGDQVPVVAAGGIFDGRGPGRRARPRRRRHLGGHPLHRHPRGARRAGLQGAPARGPRGRTVDQPGLHRQDHAGHRRGVHRRVRDGARRELQPFPDADR